MEQINFAAVSVIMERFRRYTPESFINECFKDHPDHHRAHLLSKYPASGDVLEFFPKLDVEHIQRVSQFLNDLLPAEDRKMLNHYA